MTQAVRALERAYAEGRGRAAPARIGLFGDGLPELLVQAAGGRCEAVHLPHSLPSHLPEAVAGLVEPFVDDHVRRFLGAFAAGAFDGLRAIVFSRDDAPALVAYLYAAELRRQGLAPAEPRLVLWNLVHREDLWAAEFNRRQCHRLWQELEAAGLRRPDTAAFAAAHAAARARQSALARLTERQRAAAIPGAEALRWRNAGRFLEPADHAQLLQAALAEPARPRPGLRIGCVGSALASPAAHAAVEARGTVVCDLLPLGETWPVPVPTEASVEAVLAVTAADPFCPRIVPPGRYRRALVDRLVQARCDLVLVQLAEGDDAFGWEMPALRRELAARGIRLVDLGFRGSEPTADWLARARAAVAEQAGAPA